MSILAANNKPLYDQVKKTTSLKDPRDKLLYQLPKDLAFAGCGNQICVMRKQY